MAHSATCSGCPECSTEMAAILRMDSAALSRLNTARTTQHLRTLGQDPTAPRQLRTSASTCTCGKHVAPAAPVAAAAPVVAADETPASKRVRALDVYGQLMKNITPTHLELMRVMERAFPGLAQEWAAKTPAPPMPSMTDRVRANAQPQTARPSMKDLSVPSKPLAARADTPARPAPAMPSMTDRVLAGRKK